MMTTTENEHAIEYTEPVAFGDVAKLAEALSKAQGQMGAAQKDRVNPHFKSSYATLASVIDAVRKPLSDAGIAVMSTFKQASPKSVTVTTWLVHSSGAHMRSECTVELAQANAQGLGSAITYARRYSLMALCNIAPDDDDGEAAVGHAPARTPESKPDDVQDKVLRAQLAIQEAKDPAELEAIARKLAASPKEVQKACASTFAARAAQLREAQQ